MSKKMQGIGASSGIAIAKALILKHEELKITNQAIRHPEKEIEKMQLAMDTTIQQIDEIMANAKGRLKDDEITIFEAHKQFASDPYILGLIKDDIKTNHTNAGYSINKIYKVQEETFKAMNNEYMAARATDIHDVSRRILNNYYGIKTLDLSQINEEIVLVAYDLTPSETSQLNKKYIKAFITDIGGRTSHSAIMARSMEIPAVLGLSTITKDVKDGDTIIVSGTEGKVIIKPTDDEVKNYQSKEAKLVEERSNLQKLIGQPTLSKDKKEFILAANIGRPADAADALKHDAEEIGLFRSEFLYMDQDNWPNEEVQYNAYREVLETMKGRRVVIRTLDIGGDKTLKYYKFPEELNPFLGYRAIRLCLDQQNVFKTQLKALLRAAKYGHLAIMFPMIAVVDEFIRAREVLEKAKKELIAEGRKIGKYELGMMIEIPAAAMNIEAFCKHADFFSIGTNDLLQYSMAADRMSEKVSYLYQPLSPGVLRIIKHAIDGAHKYNKPIGMCGELAGSPDAIPLLLAMGLDEFSMSSTSILATRKIISETSQTEMKKHLNKILELDTQAAVLDYLKKNKIS